jgi:hypothetical protein
MAQRRVPPLVIVFWVVIADYLAQVPYYLVNYYLPHRTPPSVSAIVLLSLTLAWFLIGYFTFRAHRRYGFRILLSFLAVEGLFYLNTMLFGGLGVLLATPNPVLQIVFLVGYATGLLSLTYAVLLVALRTRYSQAH